MILHSVSLVKGVLVFVIISNYFFIKLLFFLFHFIISYLNINKQKKTRAIGMTRTESNYKTLLRNKKRPLKRAKKEV